MSTGDDISLTGAVVAESAPFSESTPVSRRLDVGVSNSDRAFDSDISDEVALKEQYSGRSNLMMTRRNNQELQHEASTIAELDLDDLQDDQQPVLSDNMRNPTSASITVPHGVSFKEEFDRLPDFTPQKRKKSHAPPPPVGGARISQGVHTPVLMLNDGSERLHETAPFYNVTLADFVSGDVPLLIGHLPTSQADCGTFWSAVNRLNVCGIVTVNEKLSSPLPWPANSKTEAVYSRKISIKTMQTDRFRSFQASLVRVQDLDFGCQRDITVWSFKGWPTDSDQLVPSLPHFYLDFLRTLIQQTYFSCRTGQPLLIADRNGLDVAGLTAAVMMLLYQACQQRRADVWRCVADLRGICHSNIVSQFSMYEYIYDCLLQIMCATPTIMSGNFRRAFRHLLRRGAPLVSPRSGTSIGTPRNRVAPIQEQFELICKLSAMYRSRLVSTKYSASRMNSKRSHFEPRSFRGGMQYYNLPSFTQAKHFIAVRGLINVNSLLELMSKRYSRTLVWFSETPRADEILTGNHHESVLFGEVSAHGTFYSYELEAPTLRGRPWRVLVIQFVGWPSFCGDRPARPVKELLLTLRQALQHAEAVAESFSKGNTLATDRRVKPVVTLYEADAGCNTWRGAMAALAASLDERMTRFQEVDVFRTAQLFKIFDPESIVISTKQYTWCFKVAWCSYVLLSSPNSAGVDNERCNNDDEDRKIYNDSEIYNDAYYSDKYIYSYPAMTSSQAASDEMLAMQEQQLIADARANGGSNFCEVSSSIMATDGHGTGSRSMLGLGYALHQQQRHDSSGSASASDVEQLPFFRQKRYNKSNTYSNNQRI